VLKLQLGLGLVYKYSAVFPRFRKIVVSELTSPQLN